MALLIVLSTLTLLSCFITLVMHVAAQRLLSSADQLPQGKRAISVLRPLKGVVDSLEENLESLCAQTHPEFEIIVAAADPADPALQVARRVRARHPEVRFVVMHGEWSTGQNPKVRLLRQMLGRAKHGAVLISDDNVRVRADYLSVMAGALEKSGVGLVSNLVVGTGAKTLGSICENLQLNSFVISSVAASFLFGYPVVVGKSMLFRRDALMNAGGFGAVADVLAEDHLLGRAVAEAGYRVVTLGHPVYTVNVNWTLRRMISRHVRWCKIRSTVAPWIFPFELLMHPLLLSCLTVACSLLASSTVANGWVVGAIVGALLVTVSEVVLLRKTEGRRLRLRHAIWLPLRSLLAVGAHVASAFVPVVRWRNESYRIGHNSRLMPLRETRTPTSRHTLRRAA